MEDTPLIFPRVGQWGGGAYLETFLFPFTQKAHEGSPHGVSSCLAYKAPGLFFVLYFKIHFSPLRWKHLLKKHALHQHFLLCL